MDTILKRTRSLGLNLKSGIAAIIFKILSIGR